MAPKGKSKRMRSAATAAEEEEDLTQGNPATSAGVLRTKLIDDM